MEQNPPKQAKLNLEDDQAENTTQPSIKLPKEVRQQLALLGAKMRINLEKLKRKEDDIQKEIEETWNNIMLINTIVGLNTQETDW